jgi:hypothetical protein
MNQRQQLIEQIRQQSIEKRAQALREAARNQANNAPIAAAGASSSGGGRRAEVQCLPLGGLSVSFIVDPGGLPKFFLPETGTLNGKTLYQNVSYSDEGKEYGAFRFIFQASWNGSLWELAFIIKEGDTVVNTELLATSPDIYSPDWNIIGEFELANVSSEPGETFDCSLRYCFTISQPGFIGTSTPLAFWQGVPAVGFPIVFSPLFEGESVFWDDLESSWLTLVFLNEGEQIVSLGGTREQLPIGQFDLGNGIFLAISSGICSSTPPPTPPQ